MRHVECIHAVQIKIKVCQLVQAMMARRDDLTFRQEMKFRNKLVDYLCDWIMGSSHHLNLAGSTGTGPLMGPVGGGAIGSAAMIATGGINVCPSAGITSVEHLPASRNLDQACMEAVTTLLASLPLQPEESDRGDIMEAKSQLFAKYVFVH